MAQFSFLFNGMIAKTLYTYELYKELGMLVFITIVELIIFIKWYEE
jgi:hypothetical protein